MDEQYAVWNEPKKLSVPELDALWLTTLKELYGEEGDVFTYENANHLWAYISHFHRPFYVYGYACGELMTQSLYAAWPRLGERYERRLFGPGLGDAGSIPRPLLDFKQEARMHR